MALDAVSLMRARVRGTPSWPGHDPETGYVGADRSDHSQKLLADGAGHTFRRARDLAAWLGLVPRQATTGGKPRLLGITKRGNTYLRTLLIHGARAALPSLSASQSPMGEWLRGLIGRA